MVPVLNGNPSTPKHKSTGLWLRDVQVVQNVHKTQFALEKGVHIFIPVQTLLLHRIKILLESPLTKFYSIKGASCLFIPIYKTYNQWYHVRNDVQFKIIKMKHVQLK